MRNRNVFPIWRGFEAGVTIMRFGVRQSEILPNLAPYGPKRAFCALFVAIALVSRNGDDLRLVRRF